MQFLRWLGKSLVRQILLAMLLGILIGRFLFVAELPQAAEYFQILGDFFTKALRAVAPILVFVLITHAISRHQQGQARGLKTIIVLYVIGTFAAAAVAVLASTWYPTTLHLTGNPEAVTAPESLKEVLTTLLFKITDNPISAATNGNYIGILAWAILAGVALRHANSVTKTVLDDAARVIHYVVSLVIRIAPYGVFGLVTATVATTGFSTFDTYARLIAVLLGATINMAGAAITIAVLSLAAANTIHVPVHPLNALLLCFLATLGAAGASGVPGGSLMLIPMACSLLGIDGDTSAQVIAIGVLIGIIQDSAETALNSSSDVLFTAAADLADQRKTAAVSAS